jgi:hypothetical protein
MHATPFAVPQQVATRHVGACVRVFDLMTRAPWPGRAIAMPFIAYVICVAVRDDDIVEQFVTVANCIEKSEHKNLQFACVTLCQ